MLTQVDRVKRILQLYNLSISTFEKLCGLSNGTVSLPIRQGKNFSAKTIYKICLRFPFNEQWIADGEGDVFKKDLSIYDHMIKVLYEENAGVQNFENLNGNIPGTFRNIVRNPEKMRRSSLVAWAEDLKRFYPNHDYSWIYKDSTQYEDKTIGDNSNFNLLGINGDFVTKILDNAFSPIINYGDIAICHVIDISKAINWNAYYFIQTKNLSIIRKIKPDEDYNNIRCISLNNENEPIIIPRNEITKAAIVISVLRVIPLP